MGSTLPPNDIEVFLNGNPIAFDVNEFNYTQISSAPYRLGTNTLVVQINTAVTGAAALTMDFDLSFRGIYTPNNNGIFLLDCMNVKISDVFVADYYSGIAGSIE